MTPPTPVDLEELMNIWRSLFMDHPYITEDLEDPDHSDMSMLGDCYYEEMKEIILMARQSIPKLVTEIEHLRAENERFKNDKNNYKPD